MCVKHRILFCVCLAFVSFAFNSITNKKFAITNSFVSENFWNSPPKRCGFHSLVVTALPSCSHDCLHSLAFRCSSCQWRRPRRIIQKLSKLKAKLMSEAQVGARHQDARVDGRSQSELYWNLGRTLMQQTDHEWHTRLANRAILEICLLETFSFSTLSHSQVRGLWRNGDEQKSCLLTNNRTLFKWNNLH